MPPGCTTPECAQSANQRYLHTHGGVHAACADVGVDVPARGMISRMLLIFALLLFLLFGGLGFVLHLLWLGLVVAVIIAIAHFFLGSSHRT